MKKLFKTIGYICGFLFGYYGAKYVIDKMNRKNRTYFTV